MFKNWLKKIERNLMCAIQPSFSSSSSLLPWKKLRIWLETFAMTEIAARVHDIATLMIKGQSEHLNFPELTCKLPCLATAFSKDI